MTSIRAIKNHIIFKFEDDIVRKSISNKNSRSQFKEITKWGFEVSSYDEGTKTPRWAIVVSVGKDVIEDIKKDSRILIAALQWTPSVLFKNELIWRTDETKVLALDENY